jgi:hypothetical protein
MNEYYFVGLMLNEVELEEKIENAWQGCGTLGMSTIDSEGQSGAANPHALKDDMPLFPSLSRLFKGVDSEQRMLFTIVQGSEGIKRVVDSTKAVTGDNSKAGVLFVMPIINVIPL